MTMSTLTSLLGIISSPATNTTTTTGTSNVNIAQQYGHLGQLAQAGTAMNPFEYGMQQTTAYPYPAPYTNIEIINVLECKNNDDATEKLGAFRKMIPPDQDLMLFGKWIFVIKMPATYAGMAIQLVLPQPQVNAP